MPIWKSKKVFVCQNCNTIFEADKGRKYCSRKCRDAAYYQRRKERDAFVTTPKEL